MKVINPSSRYSDQLFGGVAAAVKSGKWKPDNKYPSLLYRWSENKRDDVLSLTVHGSEYQVYVSYGGEYASWVMTDIDGSLAKMSTWQGGKKDRARLYFAGKELSFSDTRELPAELRGLCETMLEALAQATQICVDAYVVAAAEKKEKRRRADAIADIKNL